ncbi:hypothetical protein E9993_09765 [Labilibacter sediminis]|nr:hypothetical protein E9993_09765 [Labilibacter sediminis]
MAKISRHTKVINSTFLSMLDKDHFVDIPVYGLSMFPFYLPGDLVRVEKAKSHNLKIGSVVVFLSKKRLVAHRLLKIDFENNIALTKGDGLQKFDSSINVDDIKAVVCTHFRKGVELKFINNPLFRRLIVFVTPLTGYLSYPLSRLWIKYSVRK